jgi:hypothetical protein
MRVAHTWQRKQSAWKSKAGYVNRGNAPHLERENFTMRMLHKREFYIPKNANLIADATSDAIAYVYETAGKPYAIGFAGKAQKPSWHHCFRDDERRAEHIANFFAGRRASLAFKSKLRSERAERLTRRKLEVGHILRTCWGYDQTNVEYFQVTKLVGAHSVEVREIGQYREETQWLAGKCLPKLDAFIGEPIVKRDLGGSIRFASYRYAYLWEGKPAYWSAYA